MTGRRFDRQALRQRLMPTAATVAGAEWSAASLTDLSSMDGIPDPEWKPVMLAEGEAVPALPTLDELAAEAGIPPSAPRFPLDS
jgi:hypothetical protein